MSGSDSLSEGVRTLYEAAVQLAPTAGVGVVRDDDAGHVVFTYLDAFGLTAYRAARTDILDAFRPRVDGIRQVTQAQLDADADRLVGSRLRHQAVQRIREADVRTLHSLQLRAQQVLLEVVNPASSMGHRPVAPVGPRTARLVNASYVTQPFTGCPWPLARMKACATRGRWQA